MGDSPGVRRDRHTATLTALSDESPAEWIVAREPPGWHGLEHLLAAVEPLERVAAELDGVHLVIDTTTATTPEAAGRIRDELVRLRAP